MVRHTAGVDRVYMSPKAVEQLKVILSNMHISCRLQFSLVSEMKMLAQALQKIPAPHGNPKCGKLLHAYLCHAATMKEIVYVAEFLGGEACTVEDVCLRPLQGAITELAPVTIFPHAAVCCEDKFDLFLEEEKEKSEPGKDNWYNWGPTPLPLPTQHSDGWSSLVSVLVVSMLISFALPSGSRAPLLRVPRHAALAIQVAALAIQVATLAIQVAALAIQVAALAIQVAALAIQVATLAIQVATLAIQVATLAIQVATLAIQVAALAIQVAQWKMFAFDLYRVQSQNLHRSLFSLVQQSVVKINFRRRERECRTWQGQLVQLGPHSSALAHTAQ